MASETSRTERVCQLVYLSAAALWFGLLVWERLDPDGPQQAWTRFRERSAEYLRWRRSLRRTLDDIESLPETP
jgi:hypothetical protein